MILRRAEVDGRSIDVTIDDGTDEEIDCDGGAIIPGLHDHHLHLHAMAAAARSVDVGELREADAALPPGDWIRAVGYHESHHGDLDRAALDVLVPARPVRVQHASGAMWVLNSAGLRAVGLDEPSGRLFGRDDWLRERLGGAPPDLADIGRQLSAFGITSVTDATPGLTSVRTDQLPQRVELLGHSKIVIADHDPPDIDDLADRVRAIRPAIVAFHCASRLGLVLALAALRLAGAQPGDRIEHGAVIPDDALRTIRDLGLTVVTQPAFVHARGDRYLNDVEPDDRPYLWRCGALLRAGIPVLAGSDAPHGPFDPWLAIRTAVDRRTKAGARLNADEAITPAAALRLFRAPSDASAGVCVLHLPLRDALAQPDAANVRRTIMHRS